MELFPGLHTEQPKFDKFHMMENTHSHLVTQTVAEILKFMLVSFQNLPTRSVNCIRKPKVTVRFLF